MLKKVRQKVATSVSKIEYTDYYEFSKWLRLPSLTHIEFGQLGAELLRSSKDIHLDAFEIPITYKSKFQFSQIKVFPIKEKLSLKRPKAVLVFFTIAKPQNLSFNNKLLLSDEETVKKNFLIEIVTQISPYDFTITGATSKEHKFKFNFSEIKSIDLLVNPPVVIDKLSEIKTEVFEIELLNDNKFTNEKIFDLTHHIVDVSNLPVPEVKRFMIPGIDDLATHVINYKPERIHPSTISEVKFSKDFRISISKSPKMDFKKTSTKVLRFVQTNTVATKTFNPLENKKSSIMEKKLLKHIITGSVKATWEKTKKVIPDLLPHQEEGAKFLADNNFAVMAEEPGSDKQLQMVGALKFLFNTSQIKSALIIIKNTRLGNAEHSSRVKSQDGLLGRISDYAPEISYTIFSSTEKLVDDSASSSVLIISYQHYDELNNLLDNASINRSHDLVIVDEFLNSFNSDNDIENLFRRFYPDHFWLLTGNIKPENYQKNFQDSYLPEGQNWKYFIRPIEDLSEKISPLKCSNIWFEPDPEQVEEYQQLLAANRDELKQVIESLNPFKFQSTVFSLIHKIKQIENFSSSNLESPKSKFLIDQLKITSGNGRKTLLLTQYDTLGLKRLEKILDKYNFRYLSVVGGSSPEDLKRALNLFYTRDDYPIFMTNLKPARLKINLKKINYIINFDQWWNPSSNWQTEEDLGLESYSGPQLVYNNYLMANSFDEIIYNMLEAKSLTNKEMFGELSGESLAELISEYDWQIIFDLSMDIPNKAENINFIKSNLSKYTVDEFTELIKRMFIRLGYRDLVVNELQDEPAFYISGRSGRLRSNAEFRAKCFLAKNVAAQDWEDFVNAKSAKAGFERMFVICTGKISRSDKPLYRKANIVEGDQLIEMINLLNLITKDTIKLRNFDEED
ncbi:MAG: hypothetical protein KGZ85_05305 [Ignavibacterium sp.]|nr:hypothetical protein [Ignavibacterium sp.]